MNNNIPTQISAEQANRMLKGMVAFGCTIRYTELVVSYISSSGTTIWRSRVNGGYWLFS